MIYLHFFPKRLKLLKHAAPVLHPPKGLDIENLSKEIAEISTKNPVGRPRKSPPKPKITTPEQRAEYVRKVLNHPETLESSPQNYKRFSNELSQERILEIFKRNAISPWGYLENPSKFYFYKIELPPEIEENDHFLPILPTTGECLIIDKSTFKMELIRRGEKIALHYVAPLDFDEENQTVIGKVSNVTSFIKRLKSRNDPVAKMSERLQFHAHSLQTMGKSRMENQKLGSALNFLANQLFMWIHKISEPHPTNAKMPNFVPSAIRLALLVRKQSKPAYSVRITIA